MKYSVTTICTSLTIVEDEETRLKVLIQVQIVVRKNRIEVSVDEHGNAHDQHDVLPGSEDSDDDRLDDCVPVPATEAAPVLRA